MRQLIFVNLPVVDLARSRAFYEAVGFTNVPAFSDDSAAAMRWSEHIMLMVLTHERWKTFTSRAIPDAKNSAQLLLAINLQDRAAVDAIVKAATGAGGQADPNPSQEYDFMYGRSFADPDGHIWEPHWLDPGLLETAATGGIAAS